MEKIKKITASVIAVVMTLTAFVLPVSADDIKIYVDNVQVYPDSEPVIIDGRALVPIRVVAEAMGYSVKWFEETETVSMQKDLSLIQMQIGSISLYSNNQQVIVDVPPQIINSRTYLPLRAVGEAMGANVTWDENTKSVMIYSAGN